MRLLRTVLVSVLALAIVPLGTAPAHAADGRITGIAVDSSSKPLPQVNWEIYRWEGGAWQTFQFGPKLTGPDGRFSWKVPLGGQYRVCFSDTYYGEDMQNQNAYWQPETRHRDTCWPNASSLAAAQTWTPTTATPSRTFTVTLRDQGLGMSPVEPFVSGSWAVGQPLTIVGQEGWRPTDAMFSYQWMSQRDNAAAVPIPGATSATFVPTAVQSGQWVFASVTATRAGYKPATMGTPKSKIGGFHVQPTAALKVTGSASPGATLTATYAQPANSYAELTWFVDGVPQPRFKTYNAATSTFPVTAAHSGARIDARVSMYAKDAVGNYIDGSNSYHRVQVQVSGARPVQVLPTAAAADGRPTVGRVLRAPDVTADPQADVSHQWLRDGRSIKQATKVTYKVRPVDLSKKLSVRVTVRRPGWWNTYRTTSAGTVAKKAFRSGRVTVSGTPEVGKKLTAKATGWTPKPARIRYQWLRDGLVIRGATKATYKVRKADRRTALKVGATVMKKRYLTVAKTSKARKVRR